MSLVTILSEFTAKPKDIPHIKELLEDILAVDPNNRVANIQLALFISGDFPVIVRNIQRAKKLLQKALTIEAESDPFPYFILGKIAIGERDFHKAKDFFEKTLSIDPDFLPAKIELAIVLIAPELMEEVDIHRAKALFEEAQAILPENKIIQEYVTTIENLETIICK